MRRRAAEAERRMAEEIERMCASMNTQLVPYGAYEPPKPGRSRRGGRSVRITVERGRAAKRD
jgi:hypothetical protein